MNIIIIGGGQKIHFLAKSFISKGYNVTIINDDPEYCIKLARRHKAKIVLGDGTKPYILEDAGIKSADLVIALTPNDPDNLVICQLAQKIYKVEKNFAIVNDPRNIEIFKKLGVETVISTALIISSLIEQKVLVDDIMNLIPIEEGKIAIMKIEVHEDDPIVGKSLKEINFPENGIVGCIIRNSDAIIPRGSTHILKDDKLVILSLPRVQSAIIKTIRGRLD